MKVEDQGKIFKGQCFNNSSTLLASMNANGDSVSVVNVFDFAEALYKEGVKRGWHTPPQQTKGSLKNPLNNKDFPQPEEGMSKKEAGLVF